MFVLLLAGALILPGQLEKRQPAPTAAPTQAQLVNIDGSEIVRIRFSNQRGETVEVAQADGVWAVIRPMGKMISAGSLTEIAATLAQVPVLNSLPTPPADEATGLSTPDYTIEVVLKDGATETIKIGHKTATASGYYAQVDGQPVAVISAASIERVIDLFAASNNPTATPAAGPATTPEQ
jgi:hypothetical protein